LTQHSVTRTNNFSTHARSRTKSNPLPQHVQLAPALHPHA